MTTWYRMPKGMKEKEFTPSTRLVYAYMLWRFTFFQQGKQPYFEGQDTIAKELGLSRKTVNLSVSLLETKKMLYLVKKEGKSHSYVVNDVYRLYNKDL